MFGVMAEARGVTSCSCTGEADRGGGAAAEVTGPAAEAARACPAPLRVTGLVDLARKLCSSPSKSTIRLTFLRLPLLATGGTYGDPLCAEPDGERPGLLDELVGLLCGVGTTAPTGMTGGE